MKSLDLKNVYFFRRYFLVCIVTLATFSMGSVVAIPATLSAKNILNKPATLPSGAQLTSGETFGSLAQTTGNDRGASTEPNAEGSQETWLSEKSEEYKKAHSSNWNAALRGALNYSTPLGDYYEGCLSGVGFEAGLLFSLNHYTAIQFAISKSGLKWDDDVDILTVDEAYVTIVELDPNITAMRYSFDFMVYKHMDNTRQNRSMLYGLVGLGIIRHHITVDMILRDNSTGDVSSGSGEDDHTAFMASFGGGVIQTLSPKLGLDLSANFEMFSAGSEQDQWGIVTHNFGAIVDIRAGLVFFF